MVIRPWGVSRPIAQLTETHAPLVGEPHIAVGPRREAEQIDLRAGPQRDLGHRAGPRRPGAGRQCRRRGAASRVDGWPIACAVSACAPDPVRTASAPMPSSGRDQLAHTSILRS